MNTILQALQQQLHHHHPNRQWTLEDNRLTAQHWYNSTITITVQEHTITITSFEMNDNNPWQDCPDVETTNIIDLHDQDFLQKVLQDYRIKFFR